MLKKKEEPIKTRRKTNDYQKYEQKYKSGPKIERFAERCSRANPVIGKSTPKR